MAAVPRQELVQMEVQNPDARDGPLIIPVMVVCNTPDEELARNIRMNSARSAPWLAAQAEHDGIAVLVGGGASVREGVEAIRHLQAQGATVFAMNAASRWARAHGIEVDYQVICDAKQETSTLVDGGALNHLLASQCHPDTFEAAPPGATLWHLAIDHIEDHLPPERVQRGGYALLGGGASVGNSALCVAFALGYRVLHLFGYDSSHSPEGESHAYPQPMNALIPTMRVEWGGRSFLTSVVMKSQAEKFQVTGQALQQAGCTLHLYGDGLLQAMWRTPTEGLGEREKYQLMWQYDCYREVSPGEAVVPTFLGWAAPTPGEQVLDLGCGTGRAGLALQAYGLRPVLVDFTDNCRDGEAQALPFLQWDLTRPLPLRGHWAFCSDVLEHIPPEAVEGVVANILEAAPQAFLHISTVEDHYGQLIRHPLHLTVQPGAWWRALCERLGARVVRWAEGPVSVTLWVERGGA